MISLSKPQRAALIAVAVLSFFGLNGVFLYYAAVRPADLMQALMHPVAAVLMLEAFVVVGLVAVALARRPLGPWGWKSFVLFSLLGGLGFSLPLLFLLNDSRSR
jgi:hypothetical protein